jgi:hypothetical protein
VSASAGNTSPFALKVEMPFCARQHPSTVERRTAEQVHRFAHPQHVAEAAFDFLIPARLKRSWRWCWAGVDAFAELKAVTVKP